VRYGYADTPCLYKRCAVYDVSDVHVSDADGVPLTPFASMGPWPAPAPAPSPAPPPPAPPTPPAPTVTVLDRPRPPSLQRALEDTISEGVDCARLVDFGPEAWHACSPLSGGRLGR
jgi:hypothetical protein